MTETKCFAHPFDCLEEYVRSHWKGRAQKIRTFWYGQKTDRDQGIAVCPADRVLDIPKGEIQWVKLILSRCV